MPERKVITITMDITLYESMEQHRQAGMFKLNRSAYIARAIGEKILRDGKEAINE